MHAALSLKGDWLEKAGFTTHSRVRVGVEQGKIIIELVEEEGNDHAAVQAATSPIPGQSARAEEYWALTHGEHKPLRPLFCN